MNPRRIHVVIEEAELLAYLTGARSLALPHGAKLVSTGFDLADTEEGMERIWWFGIEHRSFAEVKRRIPRVTARELELLRKPLRSCASPPQRGRMSRSAAG